MEDDNGKVETFMIPNIHHVPDGDSSPLSPQHWAKCMKATQRPPQGIAPEQTFHDRVVPTWNKGHSVKTIPLDHVNVATFHMASGFNHFSLYCKEAQIDTEQEDLHPQVLAQTVALIEDEPEDEETDPSFQVNAPKLPHLTWPVPTSLDLTLLTSLRMRKTDKFTMSLLNSSNITTSSITAHQDACSC